MENWVEINLNRLKDNYNYIKTQTHSPICAVIKADGYGIGSYEIAKELEELGVTMFAVAFLKEAVELRSFGIKSEILILNYVSLERLNLEKDDKFIFTIYSLEQLDSYKGLKSLSRIRFHIKINTGMNRLGINNSEVDRLIDRIRRDKINIEGIYSHFAHIEDEVFTEMQYNEFVRISENFEKSLNKKLIKHISNSGATLKYSNYNFDFVRIGMGLYGLQPLKAKVSQIKGIVTWKSIISAIRTVSKGESISYGREVLEKDKIIGIVPVGYSHGYMRQLSKEAYVLVNGTKAKILGKIFMDQMIIDVSDLKKVAFGDEVILLGDGLEAEAIAEFSNTIADDIISKISPRIERVFIKE